MAALSKKQVKNLVYWFYVFHGKFPPGTTYDNFEELTMGNLQVDDPELPGDPNYEKKKLALELQWQFDKLGYKLTSPLEEMKKKQKTLLEFHTWCFENHEERATS